MTNKEAKEKLYKEWQKFLEDNIDYAGISEAYKMAFKALEQEPCEDAISRQAVLDFIRKQIDHSLWAFEKLVNGIKDLPSVKPQEPKTGHWITKIKSDLRGDMWPTNPKCSECGGEPYYSNTIYNYKFCPYCGVKMVKPNMSEIPTGSESEDKE